MRTSEGKIYCDNCGAELEENSYTCFSCGKKVDYYGRTSRQIAGFTIKQILVIIAIVVICIIIYELIREFYISYHLQKAFSHFR